VMSGLKLIALDSEDLLVVAVHLQDAVATVADMTFLPNERRFVMLLNRFDWVDKNGGTQGVRRRTALRIEQVNKAQVQGLDLKRKDTVINLLTVVFEPAATGDEHPGGLLTLLCAGDVAIRLHVECIEVQLEDLGPAWAAKAVPKHET
jgi:hypothetical protein